MVNILQFYKETTERPPEDQTFEKFHHAGGPVAVSSTNALASPGMYPANYMGMANQPTLFQNKQPTNRR